MGSSKQLNGGFTGVAEFRLGMLVFFFSRFEGYHGDANVILLERLTFDDTLYR